MNLSPKDEKNFPRTVAEWSAQLDHQGFAILPTVICEHEISELLKECEGASLIRSRAGIRHCLGIHAISRLARDQRLLEIVRSVLGKDAFPFRATLFDKSPSANWLVVWHQDTGLPLQHKREAKGWGPWSVKQGVTYAHAPASALRCILALRIHLDDSSLENGPLRVLPGTHRLDVLDDDSIEKLTGDSNPHDCVALRGEILAMRPLLVHSSSKSHSELSRRVLHVEYASSITIEDGLELATA